MRRGHWPGCWRATGQRVLGLVTLCGNMEWTEFHGDLPLQELMVLAQGVLSLGRWAQPGILEGLGGGTPAQFGPSSSPIVSRNGSAPVHGRRPGQEKRCRAWTWAPTRDAALSGYPIPFK